MIPCSRAVVVQHTLLRCPLACFSICQLVRAYASIRRHMLQRSGSTLYQMQSNRLQPSCCLLCLEPTQILVHGTSKQKQIDKCAHTHEICNGQQNRQCGIKSCILLRGSGKISDFKEK